MCLSDLSFNSIEKIEGLGSLRKLELLNLTNNQISVIENMDALEKLTHFCFANNCLGQLDNVTKVFLPKSFTWLYLTYYCNLIQIEHISKVLYLRKFKNLFTINLRGNPVSKDPDYRFFLAAYFPNLTCLDYRLLDQKTVSIKLFFLSLSFFSMLNLYN